MFPTYVAFRLTSKCINNCKYCYGPDRKTRDLSLIELRTLFNYLKNNGVEAILLTGGEPLLRNDFKKILGLLKKDNFKIFLDTSGYNFDRYKNEILKDVDVLVLPVDFPKKSYRRFHYVFKILDYLKNKERKPIIRIGTVVTNDNYKILKKIKTELLKYSIDFWKIYQFIPINSNAIKNKDSLNIPIRIFNNAIKGVGNDRKGFLKILICRKRDRNKAYFFINSDGSVFMPIYGRGNDDIGEEKILGNVYDINIMDKWNKLISKNNYISNSESTFNYSFKKTRNLFIKLTK